VQIADYGMETVDCEVRDELSAHKLLRPHFGLNRIPESENQSSRLPRKLLVIASRFPPVASVGATRVRKFVKYLREFDWHCTVITGALREHSVPTEDARRAVDHESLCDVPADTNIHRLSPALDHWPTHLARWMAGKLRRQPWIVEDWSAKLKWRFERIHDRLAFPDRGIYQLVPAVAAAMRLHRKHRFDAIFSSGMPFSDHMIALTVAGLIRRPWLADFRDPWVEYIHWRQWQSAIGRSLTIAAEAAVARRAARIISVNDFLRDRFAERYRQLPGSKFVTISNGFDPADYSLHSVARNPREFQLLYAGSLYGMRSPQFVLAAFRRFLALVPSARNHAHFNFLGRPGLHIEALMHSDDGGTVRYLGLVPHAQALAHMAAADVNVVILPQVPGSENDTTTKIYECLGAKRPVLAAVPDNGAAMRVLSSFDGVWMREPEDVEGLAHAIAELYRGWLAGPVEVKRSEESLKPMTRRHQASQLAEHLNCLVPHASHRSGNRS
jgi:hypothetical protein